MHSSSRLHLRRIGAIFALVLLLAFSQPCAAQSGSGPGTGAIATGKGTGKFAAELLAAHLATRLGAPADTLTTPGDLTEVPGPCEPVGTILDTPGNPVSFELQVQSDPATGTSVSVLEVECFVVESFDPCRVRAFTFEFLWIDVPLSVLSTTFVEPDPSPPPVPPLPPLSGPVGPPPPPGTYGYNAQFVEDPRGGCHVIQIVSASWLPALSGERFAETYPDLVPFLLLDLERRLWPLGLRFDPACVSFGRP